jgi:hypothetical protein
MENLELAKMILRTAADGLECVRRMVGLLPAVLSPIPTKTAEFEEPASPESAAVGAAQLVSEELGPLVSTLREVADATPDSLRKQFEAAKAALEDE